MSAPLDSVFRFLPDAYRRAGRETAAYALTAALAEGLENLALAGKQVYMSRYLDYVGDLDDAERLAALFELVPWPEEDLAEFQYRVRRMAQVYLQGAAAARALLQVLAAATDSRLAEVTLPGRGGCDRYTTTGAFVRRVDAALTFAAAVVDMPPMRQSVTVAARSGYVWSVRNSTYADPGDWDAMEGAEVEPTFPDPVIDIVAGDRPVTLPILVQSDLRRLVAVNRQIPPGATVRVDLRDMSILDVAGPHSLAGPLRYEGQAVDLLFGTSGLLTDHRLTQPGAGADALPPFHLLYWHAEIARSAGPGSAEAGPIPWPGLLPIGLSNWRLLLGARSDGSLPGLDETLDSRLVRPIPATAATGPEKLVFTWIGRRLGTFTLQLPPEHLSDGLPHGPLRHRSEWLRQQVERLKLAGVLYIDPSEPALNVGLPPAEAEPRPLALWEETPTAAAIQPAVAHANYTQTYVEAIEPGDAVAVAVTKEA